MKKSECLVENYYLSVCIHTNFNKILESNNKNKDIYADIKLIKNNCKEIINMYDKCKLKY
jgi:hypothetical protein